MLFVLAFVRFGKRIDVFDFIFLIVMELWVQLVRDTNGTLACAAFRTLDDWHEFLMIHANPAPPCTSLVFKDGTTITLPPDESVTAEPEPQLHAINIPYKATLQLPDPTQLRRTALPPTVAVVFVCTTNGDNAFVTRIPAPLWPTVMLLKHERVLGFGLVPSIGRPQPSLQIHATHPALRPFQDCVKYSC